MGKPQKPVRLSTFFLMFGAILLGLVCGVGYAFMSTGSFSGFSGKDRLELGPWSADLTIGSTATDAKTRAMVARRGILALPQSEAIYFTAFESSQGTPLSEDCTYELTLPNPSLAQWWSLTVYDSDGFLPKNETGRWSIYSDHVTLDNEQGIYLLSSNPMISPKDALSLENTESPNLLLRFYKPNSESFSVLSELDMPVITPMSCYVRGGKL